LEITADEAGVDAARQSLQTLAKQLGLEQSERRSYLELLQAQAAGGQGRG
jgi:adenylate cyclase class IV